MYAVLSLAPYPRFLSKTKPKLVILHDHRTSRCLRSILKGEGKSACSNISILRSNRDNYSCEIATTSHSDWELNPIPWKFSHNRLNWYFFLTFFLYSHACVHISSFFVTHVYTRKAVQQRSIKILDLDRATCYKKKIKILNRRIKKKIIICNVSLIYKNWTGISSFLLYSYVYTEGRSAKKFNGCVIFNSVIVINKLISFFLSLLTCMWTYFFFLCYSYLYTEGSLTKKYKNYKNENARFYRATCYKKDKNIK